MRTAMQAVESAFQMVVTAKRQSALTLISEHPTRLSGEGPHRRLRRDAPAACRLARDAADGTPRNPGHGFQQMPGSRIAV
jgi:hypothetical protein